MLSRFAVESSKRDLHEVLKSCAIVGVEYCMRREELVATQIVFRNGMLVLTKTSILESGSHRYHRIELACNVF